MELQQLREQVKNRQADLQDSISYDQQLILTDLVNAFIDYERELSKIKPVDKTDLFRLHNIWQVIRFLNNIRAT